MSDDIYKVGQEIEFFAAGKVSKLDGVAGTWQLATVISVDNVNNVVHFTKLFESTVPNGCASFGDTMPA